MKIHSEWLLLLLSLIPVVGISAEKGRPPPVVEVMTVSAPTATQMVFQAIGTVRPAESILLRPEVSGRVVSIHFNEGSSVRKGDLLVKLDDALLVAELDAKMATVELAEAEYRRQLVLLKSQQVADIDVERKRAEVAMAKSSLNVLRARIKQTELRAPFDSVTGIRQFSVGEVVQAGQALVNLSSFSPLKVDVKLPEGRAEILRVNQRVDVRLDALPGLNLKGRIYVIEPQLDAGTRALWGRVLLTENDPRIRSGMTASVSIPMKTAAPAIWLPEQALVAQGGKQVVFKVVNGKAKPLPVRSGQRMPGKVQVLEGVQPGDTIVVSGQNKLTKPDLPIQAVPLAGGW